MGTWEYENTVRSCIVVWEFVFRHLELINAVFPKEFAPNTLYCVQWDSMDSSFKRIQE